MVSEKSADPPEQDEGALAAEVRALRALLEELQSGLGPGVQSALRERSSALQQLGGELDAHRAEAERLAQALEAAEARAARLEREAGRWRDTARQGLQELSQKARAAAERFETQTAELNAAISAMKAELAASRSEAASAESARRTTAKARDKAIALAEERERQRIAMAEEHERQRIAMEGSLSWRITAPLRWVLAGLDRLFKRAARLRRKLRGG